MLTVRTPGPYEYSDGRDAWDCRLVHSVNNLFAYVMRLDEAYPTHYTNTRSYNMPEYRNCTVSEEPGSGDLTVTFTFNKFGKLYEFNFGLPLFMNLPPRPLRREAVDYYTAEIIPQDANNSGYLDAFLKILYHPISKIVFGIASIANLLSAVAPGASRMMIPATIRNTGVAVKGLGALASIIYFAPMLAYYVGKNFYIPKLEAYFADVEQDIQNKRFGIAHEKLQAFPFILEIMSDTNFPGNRPFRRKFFELRAQTAQNGDFDYINALKFTDNNHDKLLSLRGLINIYERRLQTFKLSPQDSRNAELVQRCEESGIASAKWIAQYIVQIPTDVPMYHELGAKVRAQIQECIAILRTGQFAQAADLFYRIEWDGYSKHAYPDAAIKYYQMQTIFTIFSKKNATPGLNDLQPDMCLYSVTEQVPKIQSIIDKYYPEKSQQYKEIMETYIETQKALSKAKEPEREYSVTVLPDIYTPAALAAKQRAEQAQRNNEEEEEFTPIIPIQRAEQAQRNNEEEEEEFTPISSSPTF